MDKVVCYGVLCVDQIVKINKYPELDGHARILTEGEYIGGEATNSAVALERLGASVRLLGNVLGDDRRGRLFLEEIRRYSGVDSSGIRMEPGERTPHTIILASQDGHRTVMGSLGRMRSCRLRESDLDGARILSVDPFLGGNSVEAARLARSLGISVCSIEIEPGGELAGLSDVVINSAGFMRRHRMGEEEKVAEALLAAGVKTVVITKGSQGCMVFDRSEGCFLQPAFRVPVVDSTGAGDCFRAGFIYGSLQGWDLKRTVRFASAAGAINCQSMGGCEGTPDLSDVCEFLRRVESRVE